eukprot:Skav200759  [mRNA]  locus=scaffold2001:77912:83271:- [translate_table: standard]
MIPAQSCLPRQTLILDEVDQLCGELFSEALGILWVGTAGGLPGSRWIAMRSQHQATAAIVTALPGRSSMQYLFYSATITKEVTKLIEQADVSSSHDLVDVLPEGENSTVPEGIVQTYKVVPTADMSRVLWQAVGAARDYLAPPKIVVAWPHAILGLSGGLDYPGVTAVIQLGAPDSRYDYVHRVGRTGRAEAEGVKT